MPPKSAVAAAGAATKDLAKYQKMTDILILERSNRRKRLIM
jgi:hypothetical protein